MPFIADKRYDLLPETRRFLKDWLDWVDRGAPQAAPHISGFGLCTNALLNAPCSVYADLKQLFGEEEYPFGHSAYVEYSFDSTQHLNPNRLAFVRANLPET